MSYSHYERLSAMDAMFLQIEDHNSHMHIGSVAIFEAGPLRTKSGGIDIGMIRTHAESSLSKSPRFRQKLAYIPGLGHPVWVDDPQFNLSYHVRHTCLPAPGDERMLKRLAGRIMSQQLDRGKPLWESWFVEGVGRDRFAVITKLHHCLADGISGVDLASSLLGTNPSYSVKTPKKWSPRPAPSGSRLFVDEVRRRITTPLSVLSSSSASLWESAAELRDAALGLTEVFGDENPTASETPFDADLGPHRRFDWTRFDLDAVKDVKNRLGGTLNDVVLAVVSGALRHYLSERGITVDDLNFRVVVPVSVRSRTKAASPGNQVSMMMVRLPLEEANSVESLHKITKQTKQLKEGHQPQVARLIARVADAAFPELTGAITRAGLSTHTTNMVVTNVPGPPVEVFLLGAKQLAAYPVVPLVADQALGIALLSYAGGLHWGFNSDWDALSDLHDLVEATDSEFEKLQSLARSLSTIKEEKAKGRKQPRREAQKRKAPASKKSRKAPVRGRKTKKARARP